MPQIKPFQALRPQADLAEKVSARSWDSNHNHVSKQIMEAYPFSYLHVVKPHLHFNQESRVPEIHYPYARQKFLEMKENGTLEKELQEGFYLYVVTNPKFGATYPGIVGLAAVDDYLNGKIKIHEHTLAKKEEALVEHVEAVKAVGEPVLLTFEDQHWFDDLCERVKLQKPLFDFVDTEGIQTSLWLIDQANDQQLIIEKMKENNAFYIADGHHRSAGATKYAQKRRAQQPDYSGNEAFNYFLAYFIPSDKLQVFEFNRLVKDLNGMSEKEFLEALEVEFNVCLIGHAARKVKKKAFRFGMYMSGNWYGLDLKNDQPKELNVLEKLDVAVLESKILIKLLGILDSKNDDRLNFLDGTKGINRLQELVDNSSYQVAFSLFPTKITEVFEVADHQLTMPPKSTWFEPKLRTGLLIHEINEA